MCLKIYKIKKLLFKESYLKMGNLNCFSILNQQKKDLLIGEFKELSRTKYELMNIIGTGSVGLVWKVRNKKSNHEYALKEMKK